MVVGVIDFEAHVFILHDEVAMLVIIFILGMFPI